MAHINRRAWLQKSLLASSAFLIPNHPMITAVFSQQEQAADTLLLSSNETLMARQKVQKKQLYHPWKRQIATPFRYTKN